MRPTQPLFKRLKTRLRFTTKQVGKGFYRGSNVGSLGAHTRYGDYIIDWRKTRHYVVPDLRDTKVISSLTHSSAAEVLTDTHEQLTPFVSGQIPRHEKFSVDPSGNPYSQIDGMQYLRWWKDQNPGEYDWFLQREAEAEAQAKAQEDGQGTAQQEQEQEQPTR